MVEFKVGQRVEWTGEFETGDLGTVVHSLPDKVCVLWDDGGEVETYSLSTWHGEHVRAVSAPVGVEPSTSPLSERLVRHFGLAANAPEDLIFETAAKSWDGTVAQVERWKSMHADAIAQLNAVQANRNALADEMGEIARENGLLTEENRDLLAENARLRRGAR